MYKYMIFNKLPDILYFCLFKVSFVVKNGKKIVVYVLIFAMELTAFHFPAEITEAENRMNYATKYGSLTTHLDRGHLYIHHDIACQMTPAHAKILNVFIKNYFRETTSRTSQDRN